MHLQSKNKDLLVFIAEGIATGLGRDSSQLPIKSLSLVPSLPWLTLLGETFPIPLIPPGSGAELICNAKELASVLVHMATYVCDGV